MTVAPHKRILVTGGAGFLGSHLCRALVERGHDVLCVDNLSTGSERNIAPLRALPNFRLLRHDVAMPFLVEADEIYNLACPASPRQYQTDPVQTTRTSVVGALNLLGLARRQGARILQASTSEVYGNPDVHPQPEDYCGRVDPIGPRACYDEGKRCAETLCMDHRRQYGLTVRIARIFNTYGPHMRPDDGRVVSNFIVQALAGSPISIYGDGSQTRSFCYVDDTVAALLRLMEAPGHVCGPVNVGNPEEVSMRALAETVRALTGSRSEIIHLAAVCDDPQRRRPDIGMAQRELDWSPQVGLREGLERTIEYFRGVLAEEGTG
ncbi:UDP-glucuronic acid decarboxylase family protein [Massilia horti]|uniref:SDR family oxidoreductase n=1 Tax=Massilia horti TaxID=2562153 RepID=A0A4Y9T7Z1_9BURK|nr:UDP-glucuronic acid decarboxylase family protein [Massilia horti]TFW33619.1 SDR family oxidoreductase [Massilia horti]